MPVLCKSMADLDAIKARVPLVYVSCFIDGIGGTSFSWLQNMRLTLPDSDTLLSVRSMFQRKKLYNHVKLQVPTFRSVRAGKISDFIILVF